MSMRILVVGSGASGLTAIKCCLDENLEPVCLERSDAMGGLWNYKEQTREDHSSVMKSTIINTSKEIMAFSDLPMPEDYPNYLHNTKVMEYFRIYVKKFGLKKYIQHNKEALLIKRADDFETSGKWDAKIKDHKTGEVQNVQFDGVLVCTGHHASRKIPTFPGQDDFQGKMMHSQDFKHSKGWEDKRCLVIGMGNSGVDVANELARTASQVFLSTRRGTWLLPRNSDNGLPFDIARCSRLYNYLGTVLPTSMWCRMLEKELNRMYDHKLYRLQPSHRFISQHPNMSSELPMNISTGRVIIKGDIKKFTKTGVEFQDGTFEDGIDLVVMATGYKFGFPFLDKSVVDVQDNRVELYKFMFPPDLTKPTLAIIGCVQPLGAGMPVSEIQCRLATRVFKGLVKLPLKTMMFKDIREKEEDMRKRYVESTRHTIQVDFVDYMDQLAELIGCKPNIWKYLLTDPVLALKCYLGPCTPFQYRLEGPGSWTGARHAVLTVMDRVRKPFHTRPLPQGISEGGVLNSYLVVLVLIVVVAVIVKLFFL